MKRVRKHRLDRPRRLLNDRWFIYAATALEAEERFRGTGNPFTVLVTPAGRWSHVARCIVDSPLEVTRQGRDA